MQGVHDNQNDANYGAGDYRPHKNSHHYDNWTDPNPKWNKYQKREEKGGKGSTLNAKRDEVTINGYFVGHEGMAIRIYQRSSAY